jgi:hypothetical protein
MHDLQFTADTSSCYRVMYRYGQRRNATGTRSPHDVDGTELSEWRVEHGKWKHFGPAKLGSCT